MAYIYKITNDINGKIYIGQTSRSIEERWKMHIADSRKELLHRPLYSAFKKYGIEHFHIELIEETDNPNEREKYWIQEYRSFRNGYNATTGGEGRPYIDYDLVIKTYNEVKNISKVSKLLGVGEDTISSILKSNNINILTSQEVIKKDLSKPVGCYNEHDELIIVFKSLQEASEWLIENNYSSSKIVRGVACNISKACKCESMSHGFKWKFL